METSVFDRTEATGEIISPAMYNFTIGIVLCWGFLVNWVMVREIPVSAIAGINPLVFFLGYFASCMLGMYLFTSSDKPIVSFLGYNLVVVPFGLVINLVVSRYSTNLVLDAVRVTGMVTFAMMILGTLHPAFFQKIHGALTVALVVVIIVELIEVFVLGKRHGAIDWIVAAIFCGYIGYDWGRANRIPKTLDNAVDSAAALYMDIINLFIRILSIMGRRSD